MRESEIFGKKVKISGRLIRNRRDKKIVKTGREVGGNMALVVAGDFQETDNKFDRDEFDIKVGKKNYRVIHDATLDKIWCREIAYDHTVGVLFKNPKVDKDLVKGLQNFLKDSDAPENLKLNSIKYFAENEIKRIKKERLKNKQKSQFRGRIPEEYLTEATLRAIKSHQKVNKNETRKETIKRVCLLYKDKAHSEDAFTKSVMNRWNSLTADFNKKKELKKITSDFKTYTENRLKKQKKAHKQRLKRNQAGKN